MKYCMRGAVGATQFNFFNDFWFLAMYCSCSYTFENVQTVIELALKLLFLEQNYKNCPAVGGSTNQAPYGKPLSCISLFSTMHKLDNFHAKKFYFWFKRPLFSQNPGCASGRIRCCRHIFQAIAFAGYETSSETLSALFVFFSDINAKLLK